MAPEIPFNSKPDNDNSFFEHFIAGSLIVLSVMVTGLVLTILWALWSAGFTLFVVVLSIAFFFCLLTHKAVIVGRKNGWWDAL